MRRLAVFLLLVSLLAVACTVETPRAEAPTTTRPGAGTSAPGPTTSVPGGGDPSAPRPVRPDQAPHIWVLNLSGLGVEELFGAASQVGYVTAELRPKGRLLAQYHAVSHLALGNYVAQVSGQPPTPEHNRNCPIYSPFEQTATGSYGVVRGSGCVYPASVPTIAAQMETAGLSWRWYAEDMLLGAASGDSTSCRHPPLGSPDPTAVPRGRDQYALRSVGVLFFRSVIDQSSCSNRVVDLRTLRGDLATVDATPNLSFISPNLCSSGATAPCPDGSAGGPAAIDAFLREWVPRITSSPAFARDGLLILTVDHGPERDAAGCCGQSAGGGRVGALLVGRGVPGGSTDETAYNHYSLLCSLENVFGLPRLGLAADPDLDCFLDPAGGDAASKV